MTHGGKRKGSGRKKGEPKVTISFKVPLDQKEYIHTQVTMLIKKILHKHGTDSK